jgi:hypothetical protein
MFFFYYLDSLLLGLVEWIIWLQNITQTVNK